MINWLLLFAAYSRISMGMGTDWCGDAATTGPYIIVRSALFMGDGTDAWDPAHRRDVSVAL